MSLVPASQDVLNDKIVRGSRQRVRARDNPVFGKVMTNTRLDAHAIAGPSRDQNAVQPQLREQGEAVERVVEVWMDCEPMILIHLEAPMRCGRAIVSDARNHADDVGGRVRSRLRLLRAPLSHALRLPKMTPRPVHVPRRCGVEAQVDSRTQLAMRAE